MHDYRKFKVSVKGRIGRAARLSERLRRYVTSNPASPATRRRATPTTSPTWPRANVLVHTARYTEHALKYRPASTVHPLIDVVHIAFSQHRSLTLTPDSIWLVLAQGFSHHIAENKEAPRSRLVRHQGKRTLSAALHNLDLRSFEAIIGDFSVQIRDASDPVLHESLVCDFSSTTRDIRAASEVILMDAYSSYFQYVALCIRGIPTITLCGTAEDWQRLRARFEVLATYDLEWWARRVRPILDEVCSHSRRSSLS